MHRRAGDLEAHFAAAARFAVHHAFADFVLYALNQQARPPRDNRGGDGAYQRVVDGFLHGFEILRVNDDYVLIAHALQHVLNGDARSNLAAERVTRAGVVLVAGHAGYGIVEHAGDYGVRRCSGSPARRSCRCERMWSRRPRRTPCGPFGRSLSSAFAMPMATENPPPMPHHAVHGGKRRAAQPSV